MSNPAAAASPSASAEPRGAMQKFLDTVERVGNRVPHPVVIFLILIGVVMVASMVLGMMNVSVSSPTINETTGEVGSTTITARSLLSADGLRFMYSSVIPSFMGFTGVGLIIVAMMGVGVAEESGLIKALIRKLVVVAPRPLLIYILVFVGILSSVAADAGYLVLIPLAGVAFMNIGRHPIAGIAAGFAAVAGAFTVNMLIKPLDAVLTEFTNDAIHMVDPTRSIDLTANLWFSIASVLFLTVLIAQINNRIIEPRLGTYDPSHAPTGTESGGGGSDAAAGKPGSADAKPADDAAEGRGLLWAGVALVGVLAAFAVACLPANAPLRNPTTGALIGNSPFMNGLIAFIAIAFFASGAAFGLGCGKFKTFTDTIKAMEKAISGLGSLLLLLFVISQFVAYFNYSNMGSIIALSLSSSLQSANIGPLWLLLGFIVIVIILDFVITGAIAKWALFAPVFVPLLVKLGVEPEAVLAAYRVADSPVNVITPLNAYFAVVVGFCLKYDRRAGIGTVVALMLPYLLWMTVLWIALFVLWFVLGLPFGL
jgi:aminobenzoyl-glutamate transport protein